MLFVANKTLMLSVVVLSDFMLEGLLVLEAKALGSQEILLYITLLSTNP